MENFTEDQLAKIDRLSGDQLSQISALLLRAAEEITILRSEEEGEKTKTLVDPPSLVTMLFAEEQYIQSKDLKSDLYESKKEWFITLSKAALKGLQGSLGGDVCEWVMVRLDEKLSKVESSTNLRGLLISFLIFLDGSLAKYGDSGTYWNVRRIILSYEMDENKLSALETEKETYESLASVTVKQCEKKSKIFSLYCWRDRESKHKTPLLPILLKRLKDVQAKAKWTKDTLPYSTVAQWLHDVTLATILPMLSYISGGASVVCSTTAKAWSELQEAEGNETKLKALAIASISALDDAVKGCGMWAIPSLRGLITVGTE